MVILKFFRTFIIIIIIFKNVGSVIRGLSLINFDVDRTNDSIENIWACESIGIYHYSPNMSQLSYFLFFYLKEVG